MSINKNFRCHFLQYHYFPTPPMIPNSIYLPFDLINPPAPSDRKQKMERCILEIQRCWKMNGEKIQLIIQLSIFNRQDINIGRIQVITAAISSILSVHNLGVVFDWHLTMRNHVWNVYSITYCHPINISSIRKVPTHDYVISLIHVLSPRDWITGTLVYPRNYCMNSNE